MIIALSVLSHVPAFCCPLTSSCMTQGSYELGFEVTATLECCVQILVEYVFMLGCLFCICSAFLDSRKCSQTPNSELHGD